MRKAVAHLMGGNLLSKVLGLGREVFVAALFGTGAVNGAFRIAQTGTLVPINFFTSDSLNAVFIPLYKRYLNESRAKADRLFWLVFGLFAIVSTIIVAGLWWGAPVCVSVLAPGLEPDTAKLAAEMLQVMALSVPFYLLTALLNYLSMAHDDHIPMASRASVQSIGLAGGALVAYLTHEPLCFAWGFTASYVVFSGWVWHRLASAGFLPWTNGWTRTEVSAGLSAFWQALRPILLLPVFLQGNIVTERVVASLIGLVAVSALDYARFITETMLFLVSMPIAFAGLSSWSGLVPAVIQEKLHRIVVVMLWVGIPVSAFLAVYADLIVQIAFARGAFDAESKRVTVSIIRGTSWGLWAQMLAYVLVKALSAQLRNRAVLVVMVVALASNATINLLFYRQLGALTLGLGNAAYGLVLLVGTLSALGLWRDLIQNGWRIASILTGYIALVVWVPLPANKWASIALAGLIAVAYWGGWVLLMPRFRQFVFDAIGVDEGRKA